MFEIIKSGGLVMIPIFLCAFVASFIIIERILYFISLKKKDVLLYKTMPSFIHAKNFSAAENLCTETGTPAAMVLKKMIKIRYLSSSDLKETGFTELSRQAPKLERFLNPLGTIANISTLLGLLGTVTGNIRAFGVLGAAGTMGNPAILAGAIAEALVTTAAGLIVSIPTIIFYNYLANRANRIILEIEGSVSDIAVLILERSKLTQEWR